MKILFYCSIIFLMTVFTACTKSSTTGSNTTVTGNWSLVKSVWMAGGNYTTYPAKDSAVSLLLNANGTYQSTLNGIVISKDNYTISNDITFNEQDLKLQNFHATGIFSPLVLYHENSNGQIVSVDTTNFIINISRDTLILTPDVLIPAGQRVYFFVKH